MFDPRSIKTCNDILQNEIPFAIWEACICNVSRPSSLVVGLPLGVLLVVGKKGRNTTITKVYTIGKRLGAFRSCVMVLRCRFSI